MEEIRSNPAEIYSNIDYLNKKRKVHDDALEMPQAKHICWVENESMEDSNSFRSTGDSEANTSVGYDSKTYPSDEPSTSTSAESWGATSSLTKSLSASDAFGSASDCSFSEDRTGEFIDKEIENLLRPNEVASTADYVLSSGRWSVNQDSQVKSKKLTIDKEFEQYFSMLMLD